jgi:hypothetical protein
MTRKGIYPTLQLYIGVHELRGNQIETVLGELWDARQPLFS